MHSRTRFTLAFIVIIHGLLAAQPSITGHDRVRELLIESVAGDDGEADLEALVGDLEHLKDHPLDLNTATREELRQLSFLTDFQISSLVAYRDSNGYFLSIYELPFVYGFTDKTVALLLPYVTLAGGQSPRRVPSEGSWLDGSSELVLSGQRLLEKSTGYRRKDTVDISSPYPGNPWRYYARYGYRKSDRMEAQLTAEKDPGESFFAGSNKSGFDFYSAHIMLKTNGIIQSLVIGDYRLQFGQGLTLWSGLSPGKSSLPLNVVKRQGNLKAFSSSDENDFFRGAAATLARGRFRFTGFISLLQRDANLADTIIEGKQAFASFQESGYHRTASELADENAVRELAFGSNLNFNGNRFRTGFTWAGYSLGGFLKRGDKLYQACDFYGSSLVNMGLDYILTLNRAQFFGEFSFGNGKVAALNGALFSISRFASVALLQRIYPQGFFSLHSAAFSEGSRDSNEKGVYVGAVIHPRAGWTLSAYGDFFRFPWPRYQATSPSRGSDYLMMAEYAAASGFEIYIRFRFEKGQVDYKGDSLPVPQLHVADRGGLRLHACWFQAGGLRLQSRLEFTWSESAGRPADKGCLFYHDTEYGFRKVPLTVSFRYTWFGTDSYHSRIYAYEKEIRPSFSTSALFDRGSRAYLLMRCDFTESVSCWLRFSRTHYANAASIGSGYDLIGSDAKHELQLQIRVAF